ncbi:MAG: hypothetical protein GXO92_00435 [FCB group bacterium]|nr:hypothetical protein [FCB group bacterium]
MKRVSLAVNILLASFLFLGLLFAQEEEKTIAVEKAREEFGQTTPLPGEVVLGVGNFGDRKEPFSPMLQKIYGRWGNRMFIDFINDKNKQELSDYLRGFLSNSPTFFVAEMDADRLNKLGEEFNLVETGAAEFTEAKQAGRWAGLNYLVRADLVIGKDGERMLVADMINLETREKISAVVGRRGYQVSNLQMAMRLAKNLETAYKAGSPEERELIYKIQRAEAAVDAVSIDTKLMFSTVSTFYAGGAVIGLMKGGVSGWLLGVVFSGGLSGVGWWSWMKYNQLFKQARTNYKTLITEYNRKYGEKYYF